MNSIELDFMKGMVSILNEVSEVHSTTGNMIITNEQYNTRLKDLRQLEEETGVIFANSPTIKLDGDVNEKVKYLVCDEEIGYFESEKTKELGIKIITGKELDEMSN